MAYRDPDQRKARDRERFRQRSEKRIARGLCPRCGDRPPEPERSLCGPRAARRNRAGRARDARLRAEGKPLRDPASARAAERRRARRRADRRHHAGLCVRCGTAPAAAGRRSCEPYLEKRREADRARYRAGKEAGALYGGANVEVKRHSARVASRKRQKARREARLCIRCGKGSPVEGGTTCTPCREKRQAVERQQYAERRTTGCCTRCGGPVHDGLSRYAPCAIIDEAGRCPERKNALSRKRYAARRTAGRCTACGAPSQGAARCSPCAEKSYHGSQHFKGIPVWDPSWTVFELASGRQHGPFDSEADVCLCLAFTKLAKDQVEIVKDAPITASFTAWE